MQVPPVLGSNAIPAALNKGKIYISKSSPQCVLDAYSVQFQNDFSIFLESRAAEMVAGGRMVLSLMGRRSIDPTTEESCYQWELLAEALMAMVTEVLTIISSKCLSSAAPPLSLHTRASTNMCVCVCVHLISLYKIQIIISCMQGLIEEEKLDSFNAPYYAPCPEEVKIEIQKEGSFIIDRLDPFEIDWDGGVEELTNTMSLPLSRGQRVAKTIRAVVESMFELHFGKGIMDLLFTRYAEMVDDYLCKNRTKYINLVISIIKKDN